MPTTDPYSGATLPEGPDADQVPADLLAYSTGVGPQLVQRVDSQAERDALYNAEPAGIWVVNRRDGTTWIKTTDVSEPWRVVWAPVTPWQPCGLLSTLTGPVKIRSAYIGGRRYAWMQGQLRKADGTDITGPSMGGNTVMLTVPPDFVPDPSYGTIFLNLTISLAGGSFAPTGRGQLDTTSGDIVIYGNQDPTTTGTPFIACPWIAFDGVGFWLDPDEEG